MADKKTPAELRALLKGAPRPGTLWRHYKGGRYVVLQSVLAEATLTPLVVYALLTDGLSFARPLAEWSELVEHEGRTVPRFTPES